MAFEYLFPSDEDTEDDYISQAFILQMNQLTEVKFSISSWKL